MENNLNKPIENQEETKDLSKEEQLKLLETSFEMYEMSRRETIEERAKRKDKYGNKIFSEQSTKDTIELMDTMQEDVIQQYLKLGGNIERLKAIRQKNSKIDRDRIKKAINEIDGKETVKDTLKEIRENQAKRREKRYENMQDRLRQDEEDAGIIYTAPRLITNENKRDNLEKYDVKETPIVTETIQKDSVSEYIDKNSYEIPVPAEIKEKDASTYNEVKEKANYDTVTLPSKGECYKNKISELKVSHLVAYDENLIMSPSLYQNGTFLDHILKNKILDDISPDDLIQGDRDAIIIWLRAGAYGNEYPIRMTDDKSGKEFETTVDLSKLKFRKFNLKGDEEGYFDFKLPVSGDIVKFRFLTNGDVKKLERMRESENVAESVTEIKDNIRKIRSFIEDSDKFDEFNAKNALEGLSIVEDEIYDKYEDVPETYYTHDLTNRLIMSTVSINGIKDRKYVTNYIVNMSIKDASEYRKYIIENEPGVDYNIKVKRPDSLGGGYIDTFLQLDQFIFVY